MHMVMVEDYTALTEETKNENYEIKKHEAE